MLLNPAILQSVVLLASASLRAFAFFSAALLHH